MSNEVMINMHNSNALVAMAQVSQNSNNPFAVFGEYIKYCIFSNTSKTLVIQDISTDLNEKFGLEMPKNVILRCLQNIQNEGLIERKNHQIYAIGKYDVEGFERSKRKFKETENALIAKLIDFVKEYNKVDSEKWDDVYAREQFIKVLDSNNIAYDIFMNKQPHDLEYESGTDDLNADEETSLFSDSFYVGSFIRKIISEDSIYKEYLQDVCNGLMICVGAYQLSSENTNSTIKNTAFYFDTRLLLRYLGCANAAAVQAAKELVELIQKQGGNIYYFPHTLDEMDNAFYEAIKSLRSGEVLRDNEMRMYVSTLRYKIDVLNLKKATIKEELAESNIRLRSLGSYTDYEKIHYAFDKDDFESYMLSQLKWDPKVMENDVMSIWETHMLRKADYSSYCGTSKCLPVFVTTNQALVSKTLKYKDDHHQVSAIAGWKSNRLPIITDIRMTCRIWSPTEEGKKLSLLFLAANAVAAQRPTQKYINTIRDLTKELEVNAHKYSGLALSEFFDDNLVTAILKETGGDSEKLDVGTLADSVDEVIAWNLKDSKEEISHVNERLEEATTKYDNQTQQIIDGAVTCNKDKMGVTGIPLRLALGWPWFAAIILEAVSAIVSSIIGNKSLLLTGLIPIVLGMFEHFFDKIHIEKMIMKKVFPRVERKFEEKVTKNLRQAEKQYESEILERVKNETDIFVKCRNILE